MNQEEDFVSNGEPFFNQYEGILRYVQNALDDICWTIDKTECFEERFCTWPRFHVALRVGRVVSRGHERHLHGQVFVAPAGALASVAATSIRAIVHQRYERRGSRNQFRHTDSRPACTLRRSVLVSRKQSPVLVFGYHHCLRIRVYCEVAPLSYRSLRPWPLADLISSAAQ